MTARVYVAGEGELDLAVAERLCIHAGLEAQPIGSRRGHTFLDRKIAEYNRSARHQRWLVLRDLDAALCAPSLRIALLPDPQPGMLLRVAVREVEAWLLADPDALARYLAIAPTQVPPAVEDLPDPKATLVRLAGRSRCRDIRESISPRPGSGRQVGPQYNLLMRQFVTTHWRPDIAASRSNSLARCLERLGEWT